MSRQEKFARIYTAVLTAMAMVICAVILWVPASLLFRVLWGL